MYKEHQNGEAVYCYTDNENLKKGLDTPMISSSASVKENKLTLTLANISLSKDAEIDCDIKHFNAKTAKARILKNEVHAYNSFENPDTVNIEDYKVELANGKLKGVLPACSIVEITLEG